MMCSGRVHYAEQPVGIIVAGTEKMMCSGRVHYAGQPVGIIVADTE